MKKLLVVAALVLGPAVALATCTWTQTAGMTEGTVVCTTANESAPTTTAQGWQATSCPKGMSLFVCADSGQTLSGAGTVRLYVYNATAALWGPVPDLDLSVTSSSVRCQGFAGLWTVVPPSRFAPVPVSVTVSSGGLTAYWACN